MRLFFLQKFFFYLFWHNKSVSRSFLPYFEKITVCGPARTTGVEILNLAKFLSIIPANMVGIFFVKRIEFFFSKILKEGVFDYLNSLTQADLERTKKYSDIEWSEALNEEAKRMPGFADTLIKKTEIESKAKGKVKGKAEKL